jgi:Ca2+-binding RTX toxin-like protein
MAAATGTNNADVFYMSSFGAPTGSEDGHGYNALGGNDTVYGSVYNDLIQGGSGDDLLYGYGGNDGLIGQGGNDTMYGGDGDDFIHGGSGDTGADVLVGGNGFDRLSGGKGYDLYVQTANRGTDSINDGDSEATVPGYGGGEDIIQFTGVTLAQLSAYRPADTNDLWLSSAADFADGSMDDGVIIKDFYAGDANTFIEWAYTSDSQWVDLTQLI